MEISIDLSDIPAGVSLVQMHTHEFRVMHKNDKEIYTTMGQARMAGRKLLRTNQSLSYVDVFHNVRTDNEFWTEEVETLEKQLVIDL